jgi:hypothetical protein
MYSSVMPTLPTAQQKQLGVAGCNVLSVVVESLLLLSQ